MSYPDDMLFYASYDGPWGGSLDAIYSKFGDIVPYSVLRTKINPNIYHCGSGSARLYYGYSGSSPSYHSWIKYLGGGEVQRQGTIAYWLWQDSVHANTRFADIDIYNGTNNNRILISHKDVSSSNRTYIYASIYDSNGISISSLTAWVSPIISDTWYHVELVFNLDTGLEKIFINGIEQISDTQTGLRNSIVGYLYIGGTNYVSYNHYIDDVQIYDTVQHIANFSPTCYSAGPSTFPLNTFGYPFGFPSKRGFAR